MNEQQQLHLLGPVRITPVIDNPNDLINNTPTGSNAWDTPRFRSQRAVALLGYLAAERRPISRSFLASLLWPDEPISNGRASLRRELYNLTQILPACWQMDSQAVAFIPSPALKIDIYTLLELEEQERWIEAADLLGGVFLEALYLENNIKFENWLAGEQDRWRWRAERILTHVIEGQILRGRYRDALQSSQRLLQFFPWKEETHRQVMRLFSWTGQRGAALRQFETCKRTLKSELDVEPSDETDVLYQKIRTGELMLPPQRPAFLAKEAARHDIAPLLIVGREREMHQLDTALNEAMQGKGRVIFVSGGPGLGKTVLMRAFAWRAMEKHANLLVASGNCKAFSGIGDPYLPFRDIMAMLTGDVENRWDSGAITREHASRLWEAFPIAASALLDHAPNLIDVLVQGKDLMSRVAYFALTSSDPKMSELMAFLKHQQTRTEELERSNLFQQIADMLGSVSNQKPILLILDDMQWADNASISLLFHLGQYLAETNSKILILCALRPEEVSSRNAVERNPLEKLINEFRCTFGDVGVELVPAAGQEARRFLDAILDSEPNKLEEDFRSSILKRTEAHPLFTVELLRAMQARGDLIRDESGYWVAASNIDWELMPVQVEAVIKERVEQIDPKLQDILSAASVEGEIFTCEVLAEVQGREEKSLLHQLSLELERKHRLVVEQEGIEVNGRYFSRFKFSHILFQDYFYQHLCEGERRYYHAQIANALEKLYGSQIGSMAVQLAHHLRHGGDYDRAFQYYIQAAEQAASIYANDEAVAHYSQAIGLINKVSPDAISKAKLYRERSCVYELVGNFELALRDLETALDLMNKFDNPLMKWRLSIDLGKLWSSRDLNATKQYFDDALDQARILNHPKFLAESLNCVGNWHTNEDEPQTALEYHQEALSIVKNLNSIDLQANTLDLLGISHLIGGNLKDCVQYYDRAIQLFRESGNQIRLASSLTGRAAAYSMLAFLASVSTVSPSEAISDLNEAINITGEISSFSGAAWAYWALGMLYIVYGQFGESLEALHHGLKLAIEIEHKEFILGLRFGLGLLYTELFDFIQAIDHLNQSYTLSKDLDSLTHIHLTTGSLAGAYLAQGDLTKAQVCLDEDLTDKTPMDTLGKRYCWVRQAEIALKQGNSERALEIIDQLITTAPGIEEGDVITYLWMLKCKAFIQLGLLEDALPLLQTAVTIAKNKGERSLLWRAHASLGQLYMTMERLESADEMYGKSKSIVNEIAATIPDDLMKQKFLTGAYKILPDDMENI